MIRALVRHISLLRVCCMESAWREFGIWYTSSAIRRRRGVPPVRKRPIRLAIPSVRLRAGARGEVRHRRGPHPGDAARALGRRSRARAEPQVPPRRRARDGRHGVARRLIRAVAAGRRIPGRA